MRTINKILLFLLLTGIWSCDSWLDVKPSDQVSENKVFESEKGFYSALNGIYIELIKPELYGVTLSCEMVELLAQRYNPKTDNTNYKELVEFKYKEEYVKGRLQSTWNAVYKLILDCNVILENAEIHRDVLSDRAYGVVKRRSIGITGFFTF
ncbi:MAG: RagB/SusD family nutrient uptake outer membrane protein [Odoribacter sp.]